MNERTIDGWIDRRDKPCVSYWCSSTQLVMDYYSDDYDDGPQTTTTTKQVTATTAPQLPVPTRRHTIRSTIVFWQVCSYLFRQSLILLDTRATAIFNRAVRIYHIDEVDDDL
jgi:hypothetical protein